MAYPDAGIRTVVTPGLVLISGAAGAHMLVAYEHLSTTTGESQPKILRKFPLTAVEVGDFLTALGTP